MKLSYKYPRDSSCRTIFADDHVFVSFSVPDGKVCLNDKGELAVTKFAVEPVRKASWVTILGGLTLVLICVILGLVFTRSC